jgi:hypothetical protein
VSVQFVYDGTTWEVYAQIGGNGGQQINLASQVTGTLPAVNGGTGITAPGTSGNVLTSNGTAWTSAAIPSGLIFINTQTVSGASEVDFTGLTGYNNYVFIINYTGIDAGQLQLQFQISDTTFLTSNYSVRGAELSGTYFGSSSTGNSGIAFGTNTAGVLASCSLNIFNVNSKTDVISLLRGSSFNVRSGGNTSTDVKTGIRFLISGGTITGTFSLYGVKQ